MSIKDWIIFILGTVVLCLGLWLSYEIQPRESTTTITKDSSTTVTTDTTSPPDTSRTIDPEVPDPDTVYSDTLIITETDTFRTRDTTEENSEFTQIREYETTISDTLISGTIQTTVQGYLVDQSFTYTPTYPLEIRVNTKTRITKTVRKTLKPKGYPSVGIRGATDFKELRGFIITGSWTMQNGNRIAYGYNPVVKEHTIGFSYNLRNLFK